MVRPPPARREHPYQDAMVALHSAVRNNEGEISRTEFVFHLTCHSFLVMSLAYIISKAIRVNHEQVCVRGHLALKDAYRQTAGMGGRGTQD